MKKTFWIVLALIATLACIIGVSVIAGTPSSPQTELTMTLDDSMKGTLLSWKAGKDASLTGVSLCFTYDKSVLELLDNEKQSVDLSNPQNVQKQSVEGFDFVNRVVCKENGNNRVTVWVEHGSMTPVSVKKGDIIDSFCFKFLPDKKEASITEETVKIATYEEADSIGAEATACAIDADNKEFFFGTNGASESDELLTDKISSSFERSKMLAVRLQIKNDVTMTSDTAEIRLIATVDKLEDYDKVGFKIKANKEAQTETNTVYEALYGFNGKTILKYEPKSISDISNYFFAVNCKNIAKTNFDTPITAQTYIILSDGTYEYGPERTFTIKDLIIENEKAHLSSGDDVEIKWED